MLPGYFKIPQQPHCCLLVKVLELRRRPFTGKGLVVKIGNNFNRHINFFESVSQFLNRYIYYYCYYFCGHRKTDPHNSTDPISLFSRFLLTRVDKADHTYNFLSVYSSFTTSSHKTILFPVSYYFFHLLDKMAQEEK